MVTAEGDDVAHRRVTLKIEELSRAVMESIVKSMEDVSLEDIRE